MGKMRKLLVIISLLFVGCNVYEKGTVGTVEKYKQDCKCEVKFIASNEVIYLDLKCPCDTEIGTVLKLTK